MLWQFTYANIVMRLSSDLGLFNTGAVIHLYSYDYYLGDP